MTLIKEIIQISGGYTDVVDLTNQYFDKDMNSQLMEQYRPIKAHRDAFGEIAKALDQQNKRFYFLSGSYGTGKSHLCLMAANYFANPSNTLEMDTFFKNYEQAQKSIKLKPGETLSERSAKDLKTKRKDGGYLIAICRHGLNLEFEGTVLRAVEDALKGSGLELDTHFKEAIRKIEEWENKKSEKNFYNDLIKYLDNNFKGWTVEDLIKGLRENKEESFIIFESCYKEVTSADFSYSRNNLLDILKDILIQEKFKKKFKGLLIIYDEFGYALDYNKVKLNVMQEFAQFCTTSNKEHHPVVFLGTGHKPFRTHGEVGDSVNYDKIVHRVIEIGLQTQGMEDIIGAIVSPIKTSPHWKKEVEKNQSIFEAFTGECNRLKLFNWLTAPIIENNIIQNIYPMHPLSTYALLQLAREVAAENRSLFRFFSPKINADTGEWEDVDKYSYPWFIQKTTITQDGNLNLYTIDLLYEYFKDGIKTENKKLSDPVKQSIKNYQESLRTFNKYLAQDSESKLIKREDVDELFSKVLKSILINEIISNEVTPIPNTKENLYFALNATSPIEKDSITKRLEILIKIGVIYLSDGVYDLRKSDAKDIQKMVDDFKANPENHPTNLLDELLHYVPNTSDENYLEAKDYNSTYNEDKRLKCLFQIPEELENKFIIDGNEVNIFEKCKIERKNAGIGVNGYDGTAIYLFCQSSEEIEKAKKGVKNNNIDEVVVCIPQKPFLIANDIQTLKAIDSIKQSKESQDFGTLENAQINELKKNAISNLRDIKLKWFDNKNVDWFTTNGIREKISDIKKHDMANKVVEKKFLLRNKFGHTDFNKSHLNLTSSVKKILNEAIEVMMDLSQSIKIEYNLPENRGSRKYIQKCFVDNQLIKNLKSEGDFRYYEPETNKSKFKTSFPAYNSMLEEIESVKGKGWQNYNLFITRYYEEFGLGEIATSLFFLLARRYFGDSIRIKKNETDFVDLNFNDVSIPLDLVSLKYQNPIFQYEPISQEQKQYFHLIHQLFDPENTEAGKSYSVSESYSAIKTWWQKVPEVAKISQFYSGENLDYLKLFLNVEAADPYTYIKKDLIEMLGYQTNEILNDKKLNQIKEKLSAFKSIVESIEDQKKEIIRKYFKEIFNAEAANDLDIVEAIRKWYNNDLDQYQKDPFAEYHNHNNDSKPLLKKISGISDYSEFIFKTLPEMYGLDIFINWRTDKTSDFINKIKSGKKIIEENSSPIGELKIEISGNAEEEDSNIKHKGRFEIVAKPEGDKDIVYYTEDGSDPSSEKSQRKQIKKGEKIAVYGNKTIKFVVKEPNGKYGKIKAYKTIDDSQRCKVVRNKSGFFGEDQLSFIFPKDDIDVKVAMKSIFAEIKAANFITNTKFEEIILELLDELKNKK